MAVVCAVAFGSCSADRVPTRPSDAASLGASIQTSWQCMVASVFAPADCASRPAGSRSTSAAAAPLAPSGLLGSVSGTTVNLVWAAPSSGDAPSSYVVEAGSSSGLANLANFDTGTAALSLTADNVPAGTYFVRVRARNGAGTSGTSNEVMLTVAGGAASCAGVPSAPLNLTANVSGLSVTLAWTAPAGPCAATTYVLEAGSSSGRSDLANFNTGTASTSFRADGVGPGTYFVRVRAANANGSGAASNEVRLTTSAGCQPPSAPSNAAATASGTTVNVTWTAVAGASSYFVEVGSTSGASDVSAADTGSTATSLSTTLAAGTYFVRVRARNACGQSATSPQIVVTVSPTVVNAVFTITASGVSPKTLTISAGTQVTFVNNDSVAHEMTSDPHPEHDVCPEINQAGFLFPGQRRQTGNLNTVRSCGFHDHLDDQNAALHGTIVIR